VTKQAILWTTLPNGVAPVGETIAGPVLKLSVLVSPRLVTNGNWGTLSEFPDFIDWPATNFNFAVQFNNEPPIPANRVGPPPRSDLWTALFKPSSPVKSYEFKSYHNCKIHSYPVRHIISFLKEQYQKFAVEDPTEYPSIKKLVLDDNNNLVSFGKIGFFNTTEFGGADENDIVAEIEGELNENFAVPFTNNPNPPKDFLQLKLFHHQLNQTRIPPPQVPEFDFHQAVSSLGEFPRLMRLLGLVHDLEIPFPELRDLNPTVQVRVLWVPTDSSIQTENKSLKTYCQIDANRFAAKPKPSSDLNNGLLNLSDTGKFELIEVDHDGAALKAMGFANELLRGIFRKTQDTPENYSTPSLRSAGLAIARVGRAMAMHLKQLNIKNQNSDIENNSDQPFYADDLLRGYRIDVWDSQSNNWHSLCRRSGKYEFLESNLVVDIDDEGQVSSATTQASDGSAPDLYLQETLFRWGGWSLCAPRPGNTIEPYADKPEHIDNEPPPSSPFKLRTTFKAYPGSLPFLRFGRQYRLRARAVDLAGNSLPLETPGFNAASEEITYSRFEPVSSPTIVKRHPVTEGESVEWMVMRSYDYAAPTADTAERHLAPPKTSQLMAEELGMFDIPNQNNTAIVLDKNAYNMIIQKEDGSFDTAPGGAPDPNDHDKPYFDVDQLDLPYLPDPLSRGVSLRGLPGSTGLEQYNWGSNPWPGAMPFRIKILEGSDPPPAPKWYGTTRLLEVYLPKAWMVEVRYSSYLNQTDVPYMGVWQWILEKATPTQKTELMNKATEGAHWMITPYRTLTLVHAVKQPLLAPQFKNLKALKGLGDTFATLSDKIDVNGKSTSKLTVKADWNEPIDDLNKPTWETISGKATAFEIPVEYDHVAISILNRHQFGDTKYRRVNYHAIFTTRYSEYFIERQNLTFTDETPQLLDAAGIVEGSETVRKIEVVNEETKTTTYKLGDDYNMDYASGEISWVATGNIPLNQPIEVAYLVPPITRQTSAPTQIDVPNSARPDAPKVLYVLPTFKWKKKNKKKKKKGKLKSKRKGKGLRIYLDRPWWSSGDGELLGVVIWEKPLLPLGGIPDSLKPYVTQWGMDPIWKSKSTKTIPKLNDFKKVEQTGTGLSLEETEGSFSVAGYKVEYDQERQLWYCDIEVDVGKSYFPFIRLALVRYQPISVPDAHLSRVVLADFAQLTPDRSATITYDKHNPNKINITVSGLSYQKGAKTILGPSLMEASLEEKNPQLEGELSWIPVTNSTIRLSNPKHKRKGQNKTIWTGSMTVPGGNNKFRLVIKEYELYPTGISSAPTKRRLVYADHIELP
jgi:hypothetical protein